MSTTYELKTRFEVEAMPDYEAVSRRFLEGFHPFAMSKKTAAVRAVLKTEITHETLVRNPDFIDAIARRVEDEALLEKRYIFLSVNPEAVE